MNPDEGFQGIEFAKMSHSVSGSIIYMIAKIEVCIGFYLAWPGFNNV
jgi:hypothetical protein